MTEILAALFLFTGSCFTLLAAFGILRLPDLFTRLHAATKASTLGVGCLMAAVAIHFGSLEIMTRAVATTVFLLLTAPVGAHLLARAAYWMGVKFWEGTGTDELRSHWEVYSQERGEDKEG
jgi:multicomponent Na+:H+ antiporter subunit G